MYGLALPPGTIRSALLMPLAGLVAGEVRIGGVQVSGVRQPGLDAAQDELLSL